MKIDELIALIKDSGAVRDYKKTKVSNEIIEKIIEAGKWSLSVHGMQPWEIIFINKKKIISKISDICLNKSNRLFLGYRQILRSTAETIKKSPSLIIVLNNQCISKRSEKLGNRYYEIAKSAELQSVSAFIQNINLAINSMGLGSVWLESPIFVEKSIQKLLHFDGAIVSILCLGYPLKRNRRSLRKPYKDLFTYAKQNR
jgi:nitroreductase